MIRAIKRHHQHLSYQSTSDRNYQAAKAYDKVNEILHLLNQRTRIEWEPGRGKYPKSVRLKLNTQSMKPVKSQNEK